MRVVYYGRELYHTATGAQRDNHQYIARIPIGDKFRYFYNQAELTAYNAGKNIQGAAKKAGYAIKDAARVVTNTDGKELNRKIYNKIYENGDPLYDAKKAVSKAGKAVGDAATKVKNKAYVEAIKFKGRNNGKKIHNALDNALSKRAYKGETVNKSVERQQNEAASKAAGTRKWDARTDGYSRHLENLNSSKTKRTNGIYDLNREVTEKEKKQNASIKTGEEAVREARLKKQSNAPKYNQGIPEQPVIDKVREELKNASPEQLEFLEEIIRKQHRGEW